jgi:hypothetical protein
LFKERSQEPEVRRKKKEKKKESKGEGRRKKVRHPETCPA